MPSSDRLREQIAEWEALNDQGQPGFDKGRVDRLRKALAYQLEREVGPAVGDLMTQIPQGQAMPEFDFQQLAPTADSLRASPDPLMELLSSIGVTGEAPPPMQMTEPKYPLPITVDEDLPGMEQSGRATIQNMGPTAQRGTNARIDPRNFPGDIEGRALTQTDYTPGMDWQPFDRVAGDISGPEVDPIQVFKAMIASRESQGYTDPYSALGSRMERGPHRGDTAMGKYQVMPRTLRGIAGGMSDYPDLAGMGTDDMNRTFMESPELQEAVMNALIADYVGQHNTTDPVTLAMSHYTSPKEVKKYLASGRADEAAQMGTGKAQKSISGYTKDFGEMGQLADNPEALMRLLLALSGNR